MDHLEKFAKLFQPDVSGRANLYERPEPVRAGTKGTLDGNFEPEKRVCQRSLGGAEKNQINTKYKWKLFFLFILEARCYEKKDFMKSAEKNLFFYIWLQIWLQNF